MVGEIKQKLKSNIHDFCSNIQVGVGHATSMLTLQDTITHSAFKSFFKKYNKQDFSLVLILILPKKRLNNQLYVVSRVHGRAQSLTAHPCEFPCIYNGYPDSSYIKTQQFFHILLKQNILKQVQFFNI